MYYRTSFKKLQSVFVVQCVKNKKLFDIAQKLL